MIRCLIIKNRAILQEFYSDKNNKLIINLMYDLKVFSCWIVLVVYMLFFHIIESQQQSIIGQINVSSTINHALLLKRNDSGEEFVIVGAVNQLCRVRLLDHSIEHCVRTNVTSSDLSKSSRDRRDTRSKTLDNWNKLLVSFTRQSDGREWLLACGHEDNGECELLDPWNLTDRVRNNDERVITKGVASQSSNPNIRTLGGVLEAQIGAGERQQALFVAATYERGKGLNSVFSARVLYEHVNPNVSTMNPLFTPFYKRVIQQEQNPQFGKSFELLTQLALQGPVPRYVWFGFDDKFVYWIANQAVLKSDSYASTMIRFCRDAERAERYFQSMLEINIACRLTTGEKHLSHVIAADLIDKIRDPRLANHLNVSIGERVLILLMDDATPKSSAPPTLYALCALPMSKTRTGFRNAVRRCSGANGPPDNSSFINKYLSINLLQVCNDVNTTVPDDVRNISIFTRNILYCVH